MLWPDEERANKRRKHTYKQTEFSGYSNCRGDKLSDIFNMSVGYNRPNTHTQTHIHRNHTHRHTQKSHTHRHMHIETHTQKTHTHAQTHTETQTH